MKTGTRVWCSKTKKLEALIKKLGMTKLGLPYGPIQCQDWVKTGKSEDTFHERNLSVPGTLILMEDGKLYLIGDINCVRGVCDDCAAFDKEEVVVAYKVVWERPR